MSKLSETQTWKLTTDNFITDIIDQDLASGKHKDIVTRFPPEPNGYLHIGHAKSITLNFGIAARYGGKCNLRFDDTNPSKEEDEYGQGIVEDVKWLVGHDQFDVLFASDYFDAMHEYAQGLIKAGKAFVDECSFEEMNKMRGAPTSPGVPSPYRDRPLSENLDLFEKMTRGDLPEGSCVLRAKIDMSSPNVYLRDPVLYRIKKSEHHRTGSKWNIYPMYDFAHGWEDSIEKITHSLCSLEFENHRPLYDWFLDQFPAAYHPRQIEFNKLAISYTMLSKRNLLEMVKAGKVSGWDDPRMPTLRGLRRRGYTPSSLRRFAEATGYTKTDGRVDLLMLEFYIREELNKTVRRVMAVMDPIKLVITNYPEDKIEWAEVDNNPEAPETGKRKVPFTREIFIEVDDFSETPPKGYFRLTMENEVRLKGGYFIRASEVVKNPDGSIKEILCTYDPESWGGETPDGRKVKGTIHWVSAAHAVPLEARLYDKLFTVESLADLPEGEDWRNYINPDSNVVKTIMGEPCLADAQGGDVFQFMRQAYFVADLKDSKPGKPVFNRTVALKDSWGKKN